jgi:tryptophan synthase beta chain
MVTYQKYNDGQMGEYIPTDEELEKSFAKLPRVEM